jgi:hypothetical protein
MSTVEKKLSSFWKASTSEVEHSKQTIETYLYVFGLTLDDFVVWLGASKETLFDKMRTASIVELRKLEGECFNFCKARANGKC